MNITNINNLSKSQIKSLISGCSRVSDFLGYLSYEANDSEVVVAYCFMIPPNYNGRSTVLAQQVIPTMSGILNSINDSLDYHFSNKPIYVINFNEMSMSKSVATNIICAYILGFRYVDVFNRDAYAVLRENNINIDIMNIQTFDTLIKETGENQQNEIFTIDNEQKRITFRIDRLKDGINVNNEPYWYCLKAYAATYLALEDDYEIDMSNFDVLRHGNHTLDAFRAYIAKITN